MVFCQILLPILVLLAINSKFGLALPHQTIRFSFEKYVLQYVETPIEDDIKIIQTVTCSDDKSKCLNGETCCKLLDGSYGCFSIPEGVCCKDGVHCCPHATTCCINGCCPLPNAVCCGKYYCCPHHTQCERQHGGCIGSHSLPMLMGLLKFNDIFMEKVPMTIWKVKQPISTGNYIQTVSGQKLRKMATLKVIVWWANVHEKFNGNP